jgi:glycosyltransferase involved in cell wall biosynthesis
MILEIIDEVKLGSQILANGCFIEIAVARIFFKFPYVAKVPGDIVWERARTSGRTSSDIEKYQTEKLTLNFKLFRALFSLSLKRANSVIVPSNQLSYLCQEWGVSESKLTTIGNSVDIQKFKPGKEFREEYDFVTVCRLVPWKGVAEIIQCAKKMNASLLVIGDGPERQNLEKIASTSQSRIDFIGSASRDEVSNKLRTSKVFVLNSSFEATSYSLIEAMASGLPGIANANTGSEEIISNGVDGYLCGSSTGLALQDAMFRLKDNPELVDLMSKSAVEKISTQFSTQVNFPRIQEIIANAKF